MNIRGDLNTFLCGIPSVLWVSFQTGELSPEGCCLGQCLSVNTTFHATDDMFSESPQYRALIQLTTKSTALYILICGEGSACLWPPSLEGRWGAARRGLDRWPSPLFLGPLFPSSKVVPQVTFSSYPTGVPGEAGMTPVAGTTECMWMGLWEHVFCPGSACALLSDQEEQNNYQICRCPLAWPLGATPDWKELLSHSAQNKMWAMCNPFFMPCSKKVPWSSQFHWFWALLKLSGLPAMRGLDYQRLIAGKSSLSLVCWGWTVELNNWLSGCQQLGEALRGQKPEMFKNWSPDFSKWLRRKCPHGCGENEKRT